MRGSPGTPQRSRCTLQMQPLRCADYACRYRQILLLLAARPREQAPSLPAPFADQGFHAEIALAPQVCPTARRTNPLVVVAPDQRSETMPCNSATTLLAIAFLHGLARAAFSSHHPSLPGAPQTARRKTAIPVFSAESERLPESDSRSAPALPAPSWR